MKFAMHRMLTFLLLILLGACGNDKTANEEKLYADFVMRYNQDNGNFNVKAKFKTIVKGVQETEFFPATGVSFMDLPMYDKNVAGIGKYYEYDGSKHPKEKMIFRFLDQYEKSSQLETVYSPMRNLSIEGNTIAIDSGFTLTWEGEPLMQGNELLLSVKTEGSDLQKIVYTGATKSNKLYYRKEQLAKLTKGNATLSFMKLQYKRFPEESKVGGSYTLEYHFKPIEIEIK